MCQKLIHLRNPKEKASPTGFETFYNRKAIGFPGLRARPGKRQAFTLVELLVVIAIIAILTTAGMRGFKGWQGTSMTTSAGQIVSAISNARDLAVAENCRTRFIIVTGSSGNPSSWRLHRYGILRVPQDYPDISGTAPFIPVTSGQDLTTGVYFRPDRHLSAATAASLTGTSGNQIKSIFDQTNLDVGQLWGGEMAQYAYIEFQPSGGTTEESAQNIFEIEVAPSADIVTSGSNYVRFGVAHYTGSVEFERPSAP